MNSLEKSGGSAENVKTSKTTSHSEKTAANEGMKSKYFTGKKSSASQPSKRPHSEVANTSAEEMTLICQNLEK